jgi:ribosome-associated translation inhibitor RaiA
MWGPPDGPVTGEHTVKINVYDGPMPSSEALNGGVVAKLDRMLRKFASRIGDIEVRFRDLNAGRGGVDKQCRILAYVHSSGPVVVEARHADYYGAMHVAAEKLHAAVTRQVVKRRGGR